MAILPILPAIVAQGSTQVSPRFPALANPRATHGPWAGADPLRYPVAHRSTIQRPSCRVCPHNYYPSLPGVYHQAMCDPWVGAGPHRYPATHHSGHLGVGILSIRTPRFVACRALFAAWYALPHIIHTELPCVVPLQPCVVPLVPWVIPLLPWVVPPLPCGITPTTLWSEDSMGPTPAPHCMSAVASPA